MMLVLSSEDLSALSVGARSELLKKLGVGAASTDEFRALYEVGPEYQGVDMSEVADLTFRQVQTWMEAASDKTKLGLRVMAKEGPVVRAQALIDAGIENIPHFQSRTTIRTRTVTGDKGTYLLGWDDWSEAEDGKGKYAVTPITYQSLRRYFQLD